MIMIIIVRFTPAGYKPTGQGVSPSNLSGFEQLLESNDILHVERSQLVLWHHSTDV